MKHTLRLLGLSFALIATQAFAEWVEAPSTDGGGDPLGFEIDVHGSYVGEADVERGSRRANNFDEANFLARFLILPSTPVGILRIGGEYETYEFGMSNTSPIPDTLQSIAVVLGLDTKLSDSLLIRFEAKPGYYSADDVEGSDFNAPFILGGTYLYSSTLQFVFGVGVDYESEWPVLPGGGFRWKFAPQWVLNATVPTPRLEYEVNRNLLVWAGGEIKGKTFRVDSDFGDRRGPTNFNDAVLSYREVRTGAGLTWRVGESCELTFEGGYVPYRKFDYHRVDLGYDSDGGAPYGAVSFNAAF